MNEWLRERRQKELSFRRILFYPSSLPYREDDEVLSLHLLGLPHERQQATVWQLTGVPFCKRVDKLPLAAVIPQSPAAAHWALWHLLRLFPASRETGKENK
jgi:hypothetical protein